MLYTKTEIEMIIFQYIFKIEVLFQNIFVMRIIAFSHLLIGQLGTSCCLRLERQMRKRAPHTHTVKNTHFLHRKTVPVYNSQVVKEDFNHT